MVRGAVEGVADLEKGEGVPSEQEDVQWFLDGTAASFGDGPRVVGGSRGSRARGIVLGHATSNGPLYTPDSKERR